MNLRKHGLFILIALAVFSGLLVRYLDRAPVRHYCDFRVYYKAGQDLIEGKNIYFRENEETTPFKYSPFFAFAFAPLSLLPIKVSASVFFAINFLSTLLFIWLAFRLVVNSPFVLTVSARDSFLICFFTVLCSLQYIFQVWDSGQVNILMCTLVLAGLSSLSRGKDCSCGVFFAAAILIKYTPFLFVPYFLFQKKFKAVLWIILFLFLFLMLPAQVVGIHKNLFYLSSWIPSIISTSLDNYSYVYSRNQSIFSMILRFFSQTQYHVQLFSFNFDIVLKFAQFAAVLLYLPVFLTGKSILKDNIVNLALLMIGMSLFNPNAWLLNFVSLILAYTLLIWYLLIIKGRDMFLLFSIVASFFLSNIFTKDILGKAVENFAFSYSFTVFGALIIYFALIKLKFFTDDLPGSMAPA